MSPGSRRLRSAAIVGIIACASTPARADATKQSCIDANTTAQALRREGKLAAAREQLRQCADPSCPALVRDDCTVRLDDLEHVQPTIIFDAKDPSGKDVSAVKVTVDGRGLADTLDGTPLQVDPGSHVFTFTLTGSAPQTQTFVIKENEKDRRERIVLGASTVVPAAPAPHIGHLVVLAEQGATVTVDDKIAGEGHFDGSLASGPHEVRVTEPGKVPYKVDLDLRDGEMRTLQVTLEEEPHKTIWPWIVGGAAVAVGAAVGGYFMFRPSDTVTPVPPGKLGGVTFMSWRSW